MTTQEQSPEQITVVDEQDNVVGAEARSVVRQKGLIHRIVRIILTNPQGQILIQQRAASRGDNPLRWDWSAAGHVDAGEAYETTAQREVEEEIGITDAQLIKIDTYYIEETPANNSLLLRRFTCVFRGRTDQQPTLSDGEVAATRWISPSELTDWVQAKPSDFTPNVPWLIDRFGLPTLTKN
jgi:isopentenyldiphosphate isomerase